ncbi:transmembrane protein 135-like [Haematobia irritans]|uniref:transmembrane protein 135-like n=1 Tax=Haematobia irritans TaxID=7368 RepID=UPI003F50A3C0
MVALSKLFNESIHTQSCKSLSIHSTSCLHFCLRQIPLLVLSNCKYYAPICIIPMVLNLRKLNKKKVTDIFQHYFECALTSSILCCTLQTSMCALRNILGCFYLYTFVFIPSYLGGCVASFGSARARELFAITLTQANIHSFFLKKQSFASRLLANSSSLQTIIFMICSAIILQGKQLHNTKGFWILEPNRKPKKLNDANNDKKCQNHANFSCKTYLMQGMRKYFLMGLAIEALKALTSKTDNTNRIWGKLKNFRIGSVMFLITYIGIYRFVDCFLNRQFSENDRRKHITSAFLAGICYKTSPQLNLLCYAITQAIRTLWSCIKIEHASSNSQIMQVLMQIPFDKIILPFSLARITHIYIFRPEFCSSFAATVLNGSGNNRPYVIKNIVQKYKKTYGI